MCKHSQCWWPPATLLARAGSCRSRHSESQNMLLLFTCWKSAVLDAREAEMLPLSSDSKIKLALSLEDFSHQRCSVFQSTRVFSFPHHCSTLGLWQLHSVPVLSWDFVLLWSVAAIVNTATLWSSTPTLLPTGSSQSLWDCEAAVTLQRGTSAHGRYSCEMKGKTFSWSSFRVCPKQSSWVAKCQSSQSVNTWTLPFSTRRRNGMFLRSVRTLDAEPPHSLSDIKPWC